MSYLTAQEVFISEEVQDGEDCIMLCTDFRNLPAVCTSISSTFCCQAAILVVLGTLFHQGQGTLNISLLNSSKIDE